MAKPAPIADRDARETALDIGRSFIVQAPAGSGKTELLVQRYSRLLATVEKPEEIVAITFTIKAAAEMRLRVLKNIPNAAEIGHRLRIQTIDAFCASLTRQMPVVSQFGAQPGVVEDAREHYEEAASRTIMQLSPSAATLLMHLDNNVDTATSMVASMLAKRDQWLRKTGDAPTREELEAALVGERARLLAYARSLHPKASLAFAESVLTKSYTWRVSSPLKAAERSEPLRHALEMLLRMPDERYTDEQWEVLGAIMQLLPLAAGHLKAVFAERGETDFTEVAQGAVRALGSADDPSELLLSLDNRLRHVLVDEFQDTSYSQFELLQKLTSGWERGDGRTLFLVGDPMQSIYRFREAKVALFLQAWESGLGVSPAQAGVQLGRLTLSTNFRSQPALVDWFNASFSRILPPAADPANGAVPYAQASPSPEIPARPLAPIWHNLADRSDEAAAVVRLIEEAKSADAGPVAILVRNRSNLAEIVPALKAARIRYRAIEIENLGERQVVQDLYAITRALMHLGDRIAWLSLLRAPWLGFPLARLLEIAGAQSGNERHKTIWELIKDDLFLGHFTAILAPAVANRSRGSLRERVEGVWLALGGPACLTDRTELEDAERYLDELERLEAGGPLTDLALLSDALDELFALPDVDAGEHDVQIMTIHKAKGLEFGTVVVPGLDSSSGTSDSDLLLFNELVASAPSSVSGHPPVKGGSEPPASGGLGLLLAPIKATGADKEPTYRYLAKLDREAEDVEASRLLYVAATRAKHRLHLLACLACDASGALKEPARHTLLERAWPVASDAFHALPLPGSGPLTRGPGASGDRGVQRIKTTRRLPESFRLPPLPAPALWTAPPEGREEEQIEFSWVGETARHVGTVVHRWLQRIAIDELRGWDSKRVDALVPAFSRDLERRGVPKAQAKAAADQVATALKNSISDDRGRWILGSHPEAFTEHRMRLRADAGVRSFVIDRMFRDASGDRWIVDFKTSRHEGAGLEQFLDEQRTRYEPQLNTYAGAFDRARAGLYFPMLRGWREWGGGRDV